MLLITLDAEDGTSSEIDHENWRLIRYLLFLNTCTVIFALFVLYMF